LSKKQDEVLGHTVSEVLGKDAFEKVTKQYLDECFAGKSVRFQSWFNSPGIGKEYLDVRYQPFFTSDNHVLGVVVSSRDITDRKYAEDLRIKEAAAQARSDELNRSRQRIVAAQESLRKQLAQQLHGTVQTKIILILHRLAELKKLVTDDLILGGLEELNQEIENLLELDIRALSHQLYPSILRQGLIPALQSLCDQFERKLSIDMKLDEKLINQEPARHGTIPEAVKLAAYRIVEESLNNVIKHGHATHVTVILEYTPGTLLQVRVEDNGEGFDTDKVGPGLGMAFIQSYADITSGKFDVISTPGKGTEITATFPLNKQKRRTVEF
jgi:signal transduction histidine kinase